MGRVEVTWDEFEAWYRANASEGRTDTRALDAAADPTIDAVTGATTTSKVLLKATENAFR